MVFPEMLNSGYSKSYLVLVAGKQGIVPKVFIGKGGLIAVCVWSLKP